MRRLVICLGVLAALAAPSVAHGDAVIDWSLHAQTTILSTGPTAHHSTLSFAMVQGAVYDAVNSIDRRHQRYLRVPWAKRTASKDAAAATAAFRVLTSLFPAQTATLQGHYDASLAAIPPGKAKTRGIAAGEAAADGDARRARERRAAAGRHAVPVPAGHDTGRLARLAAAHRRRPGVVGRQREAVHGPERALPPHRRAEPADQPRVRAGPQRGQASSASSRAPTGPPTRRWPRSSGRPSRC